jgi:hypothetical protein
MLILAGMIRIFKIFKIAFSPAAMIHRFSLTPVWFFVIDKMPPYLSGIPIGKPPISLSVTEMPIKAK